MQLLMDTAQIGVQNQPNGIKAIVVTDVKSGLTVVIPMTLDAARSVGAALTSSLIVAGASLPPNGPLVQ